MSEIGYGTKTVSVKTYRKQKIKMLEKDFLLNLSTEEKNRINELETIAAIDRYARTILRNHWN